MFYFTYDKMENMSNSWAASGKRMAWMEASNQSLSFPYGEDFTDFKVEQNHTIVSYKTKTSRRVCAYFAVIKVEVFKDSVNILMSGMTSRNFWGQSICSDEIY